MATEKASIVCETVGELKRFIHDLPDDMPCQSEFDDELIRFSVLEPDPEETGHDIYLLVETF